MASKSIRSIKELVVFVTGAASGLGKAAVDRFVREGCKGVIAFDLNSFDNSDLKNKQQVVCVTGDVKSEESVSNAMKLCESKFGKLDAVLNCAGIGIAMKTLNEKTGEPHDLSLYEQVININLVGTFNVNRLGAALIAKNEPLNGLRGVLVNTASVAAFEGQRGQTAYSSSKGGIVGMTLPMARDLATVGIRVNTIAPGLFLTPLLQQLPEKVQTKLATTIPCPQRLGDPDEYAHLAQFILENPMMNGEVVRIDGALRMQP
ncbi:3-hydroxyacyl-CoA dehydrogenase type-2-like protein [Leptotrombidium deliense]|uniref:3-hydroxyacyl-CoA dehydrogenase type-2 n=1 Tax=Leptotrombidium deliense TaxID=299467 RepID=A0A443SHB2_9ACAR|nr:3-hydroxyacyl-CoA dehydrogenase type-2-like protein [Leptotrombidium deliense]